MPLICTVLIVTSQGPYILRGRSTVHKGLFRRGNLNSQYEKRKNWANQELGEG